MENQTCSECGKPVNPDLAECWHCGKPLAGKISTKAGQGSAPEKVIAGFWIRLFSDILDTLLLGIAGFALTYPLRDLFYALGENGLWIGILIAFLYAGLLHSRIGKGQSLAKRVFRIQVLRLDGSYMGLGRSFLRYSVLALIFYNGWVYLGLASLLPFMAHPAAGQIYGLVILFFLTGLIVLLPLHPLKRGIQDLIAGTLVVKAGRFDSAAVSAAGEPQKIKRAYSIWIASALIVIAAAVFAAGRFQAASGAELARLYELGRTIEKETPFENVAAGMTIRNNLGSENPEKIAGVSGFLYKEVFDNEAVRAQAASDAARMIAAQKDLMEDVDYIYVGIRSGYNIGIANLSFTENRFFDVSGNYISEGDLPAEAVQPSPEGPAAA